MADRAAHCSHGQGGHAGEAPPRPARLLAIRVPQEVAAPRRQRLRAAARTKGRPVSAPRLAWAAWPLRVATVPCDRLTRREALGLVRVRWQRERRLQLWKSHGPVAELRRTKPWGLRCTVYAKRLARRVPQWVCRVRCWASPTRSLVQAAQTVQQQARHRASAVAASSACAPPSARDSAGWRPEAGGIGGRNIPPHTNDCSMT
jgi:hypothetical protein